MKQKIRNLFEVLLRVISLAVIILAGWLALSIKPAEAAETRVVSVEQGRVTVHQTQQLQEGCLDTASADCWKIVSQVIEGGRFTPPDTPPKPLKLGINLLVDTVNKTMMYYVLNKDGSIQPIEGWIVVTASPDNLVADEVEGQVKMVDYKPTWGPTPSALIRYPYLRDQLKEIGQAYFPFGHPSNAMGIAKILIDWKVPPSQRDNWSTKHIHASGGVGARDIFADTTLGCVRMFDSEIIRLLQYAGSQIDEARVLLYR